MPLSRDCRTNPFRVPMERVASSESLLHAVVAISAQHLSKKEQTADLKVKMHEHWSAAIQLFRRDLNRGNFGTLIDTLLILINLEVSNAADKRYRMLIMRKTSQSATSMWSVHLNGARRLLEQDCFVGSLRGNPRLHAQVAMLVWYAKSIQSRR